MDRYKSRILAPFGSNMIEVKLPDNIYKEMIKITDKVIEDKEIKHGRYLAGHIEHEWRIAKNIIEPTQTYIFLKSVVEDFIKLSSNSNLSRKYVPSSFVRTDPSSKINIEGMWVNEMRKYEYNPIHQHPGSDISSVIFLKVPDLEKSNIGRKGNTDGKLEFVSHTYSDFDDGTFLVYPEEAMMYVFPGRLLHTVYPFNCEGVRRSVSFNSTLTYNGQDRNG